MLLALGDELCTDHVAAFVPHEALLLLPICPVPPGNMLKVCSLCSCTEVEQAHAAAAVQLQASRISQQA